MNKKYLLYSILIVSALMAGTLYLSYEPEMGAESFGETSISIDGVDKEVKYTDDNIDEDLIIKSDQKDYMNLAGNIAVYFSIFNNSGQDQNVSMAFSLNGNVRHIWEYDGEEEIITPAYEVSISSTTKETKTIPAETKYKTIWKELETSNFIVNDIERKDTKDKPTDKGATSFIKAGKTKFFKATLNIIDFTDREEFFIEAFGEKGSYGHLDPWTYEQKFNSLDDGDLNGQDNWSGSTLFDVTTDADARYEGAKGVKFQDSSASSYTIENSSFTASSAGTFYIAFKRTVNNSGYLRLYLYEGANLLGVIHLTNGGKIAIFNGATTDYIDVASYSVDQWYVVACEFSSTNDNYRIKVYDVTGESWSSWSSYYDTYNTFDEVSKLLFRLCSEGTSQTFYMDTITPTDPTVVPSEEPTPKQDVIWFD